MEAEEHILETSDLSFKLESSNDFNFFPFFFLMKIQPLFLELGLILIIFSVWKITLQRKH